MARGYLNPAHLPEGTRVGPWRLLDRRGRGSYGAVHGLAVASLAGALALGVTCMLGTRTWQEPGKEQATARAQEPDAGTAAIGDSTLTAPVASPHAASGWSAIGLEVPSKPLPGQTRPDASGRCVRPPQVPINGGCWLELNVALKDCRGNGYVYKGKCYTPAMPPLPTSTSSPTEAPDGG